MVAACSLSLQVLVAELFRVAKEVRAWSEVIATRLGHNPETLQGMCVIAAYELFDRLSKNTRLKGHSIRFAKSEFHAFVLVDALTVDVTATQFRNTDPVDGVWIVDLTDEPDPGVWRATEFAASTEDVQQLHCWCRWPRKELPLPMQGGVNAHRSVLTGGCADGRLRYRVQDKPQGTL